MNIKGMDKNMKCRGFQFEVGKEYKIERGDKTLELCSNTVFHYCKTLAQVHDFYNCNDDNNRYFEIEVLGEEITDGTKCGSDHIKIVREIVEDELDRLKGLDGTNTGLFNSGDCNSGNHNSGDLTAETVTAETTTAETVTAETTTAETVTAETGTTEATTAETVTAETITAETVTAALRINATILTVYFATTMTTALEFLIDHLA